MPLRPAHCAKCAPDFDVYEELTDLVEELIVIGAAVDQSGGDYGPSISTAITKLGGRLAAIGEHMLQTRNMQGCEAPDVDDPSEVGQPAGSSPALRSLPGGRKTP